MSNRIEDLVEIQQLLARYAVTITQEDIDGLGAVFTPDGTYSAFGETYSLDPVPGVVDCVPHRPGHDRYPGDRSGRRHRDRNPTAVLHRPWHPRHADRLLQGRLCADRRRVAAENPRHDVHSAQRHTRL